MLPAAAALPPAAAGAAHAQEGVQVLSWWPEHPTKSFFAGKKASCVLGVRNTGQDRFNVTYAMANLASPYNATMNLFNFTGQVGAATGLGGGCKERPQSLRGLRACMWQGCAGDHLMTRAGCCAVAACCRGGGGASSAPSERAAQLGCRFAFAPLCGMYAPVLPTRLWFDLPIRPPATACAVPGRRAAGPRRGDQRRVHDLLPPPAAAPRLHPQGKPRRAGARPAGPGRGLGSAAGRGRARRVLCTCGPPQGPSHLPLAASPARRAPHCPPPPFLQVSLFYSSNGAFLQREFFNETITIIEEPTWLDTQLIGLYIIGLAVLAGIREWRSGGRRRRGWGGGGGWVTGLI